MQISRVQYNTWFARNEHLILPSRLVIRDTRFHARAHGLNPEALIIFASTDMLIRAVDPDKHNAYLSYVLNLWGQPQG